MHKNMIIKVLVSLLFLPGLQFLLTTIIAHTVHLAMRENV
jgi:hypothetical protein